MREILHRIGMRTIAFASGTMVSRLSGFFRDILTAALLGATKELALFFIAFRFANVFRRLLAETPLSSSVLPYAEKHPDTQKLFFQLTGSSFLIVTFFLVGCFLGALFLSPKVSNEWSAILELSVIMLPSLVFLVGTGINHVFLQLKGLMFPMSVSSSLCNLVWIAVLPFAASSQQPSVVLSWGVLSGFVLQYIFTLFCVLRAYSFSIWRKEYTLFTEVMPIVKPFLLALLGIAATQVNNALDPLFAKVSMPEAPAYLWYSIRIYLLPLSIVGIAFFSASFPELSKLWNGKNVEQFTRLVRKGASYLFAFFIPLSILMIFCAEDLVTVLFYRGAFTMYDVAETAACLRAYTFGLAGSALVLFFSNVHFAQGNYRWPALASGICVGCNILLNTLFVFVFELGAASVALATGFSAWVNMLLLCPKKIKMGVLYTLFAAAGSFFITLNIPAALPGSPLSSLLHGASSLLLFGTIYCLFFLGKKKAESK